MNEYDVKKALAKRSGQQNNAPAAQSVNGIPNSVLADVFAGKRSATSDMMGHREDLAPSIAAKMSQSFGMDFSAVKVYRSDAMAGTEMQGMAQGDRVVLSSDVDLNTQAGQATLGHELSHIRAQSMGMGSGRGLLNDASLEHQADSEGMLAARGMNISGESMGMSMGLGMAGVEGLSPIGAGLSASAGAPMQAEKGNKSGAPTEEATWDTYINRMKGPGGSYPPLTDDLVREICNRRLAGEPELERKKLTNKTIRKMREEQNAQVYARKGPDAILEYLDNQLGANNKNYY